MCNPRMSTGPAQVAASEHGRVPCSAYTETSPCSVSSTGSDQTLRSSCGEDPKKQLADNLIDTVVLLIERMWPPSPTPAPSGIPPKVVPLRVFVYELLRQSHTSFSTLHLALLYLVRLHTNMPKDTSDRHPSLNCGRRMLLVALCLATKFLLDSCPNNRAWASVAKLPIDDINAAERAFLEAIHWKLDVSFEDYSKWSSMVFNFASQSKELIHQKSQLQPRASVSPLPIARSASLN
ncbi:uncharacterized protein BJ171DRAFT_437359 [Polychytrium aggregatum]|uniref:uncharacterized protein n=1 Tax=Polychytrium aggregatum TaxID=110093 RepID=UPI0022FEA4BE|nr:uncharacterized protein BJ171DRAFT_437359 [Polychytrium aggregatum]KAI9209378.1 hypothetical protein BJ171DRAFT_437359 [Polychytrium aggregatum]